MTIIYKILMMISYIKNNIKNKDQDNKDRSIMTGKNENKMIKEGTWKNMKINKNQLIETIGKGTSTIGIKKLDK